MLGLPGRRELVERAARTGEVAISSPIRLSSSDERGLLVIAPVFESGRLAGVVSGAYRDSVLVGAVRARAAPQRRAARDQRATRCSGTRGSVPRDAERSRVAYGGQTFEVAVAAPHPGLRFGPLALGARRAADGARRRPAEREPHPPPPGGRRGALRGRVRGLARGPGPRLARRRLRPRQPGAVRDHRSRGARRWSRAPRPTSCTRPTAQRADALMARALGHARRRGRRGGPPAHRRRRRPLGADALHAAQRRAAADAGHRRLRAARPGGRAAPPGRARHAHRAAQPPRLPAPAGRAARARGTPRAR